MMTDPVKRFASPAVRDFGIPGGVEPGNTPPHRVREADSSHRTRTTRERAIFHPDSTPLSHETPRSDAPCGSVGEIMRSGSA